MSDVFDISSLNDSNISFHCESGIKILVAYATRLGTTQKIAETIGKSFNDLGASVDVLWVGSIHAIDHYDAVVVGSAIRYDRWLPEAKKFVMANNDVLQNMPVAYFFACLTAASDSEKSVRQLNRYASAISNTHIDVKPIDVGQFAGVLNFKLMPLSLRLVARLLFKFFPVEEKDYRDWKKIRSWSEKTYKQFMKITHS